MQTKNLLELQCRNNIFLQDDAQIRLIIIFLQGCVPKPKCRNNIFLQHNAQIRLINTIHKTMFKNLKKTTGSKAYG